MRRSLLPLLASVCPLACGAASNPPPAADPCADASLSVTRVWNEQVRVDVRAKWQGMGGELGGEVETTDVEQVISSMDSLSDDWARMRQAVCLDHFKRGTLTKAEYQRRADCLDELLSRQRTLVTALSAGTETTQEQMRGLSDALSNCR